MSYIWNIVGNNMEAIVAVCALLLTIYQFISSHKHNKLSVTPYIANYSETTENDNNAVFSFEVANNGIGPAKIKTWEVCLNKENIEKSKFSSLENYVNYVLAGRKSSVSFGHLQKGHLMSIGEVKNVLKVTADINNKKEFIEIKEELNKLGLIVKYQSIYGDEYTLDTHNS